MLVLYLSCIYFLAEIPIGGNMNQQLQLLLEKNISEMTRQNIINWLDELKISYCDESKINHLREILYKNIFHQLFSAMEPSNISNLFAKLGLVQVKPSRRLSTLSTHFRTNPSNRMNILKLMSGSGDCHDKGDSRMVSVNNSGHSYDGLRFFNPSDNSCFVNASVISLLTNCKIKKRLMSCHAETPLITELKRLVNCQTLSSSAKVRYLVSAYYLSTQVTALHPEKFDDCRQHDVAEFYLALLNCLGNSFSDLVCHKLEETLECSNPMCKAPATRQVIK